MRNRITFNLLLIAIVCLIYNTTLIGQTAPVYLITGQVFDETNRRVSAVRVCAVPDDYASDRRVNCGISNLAGEFVIQAKGAGGYRIIPDKSAEGYHPQVQPFYKDPSNPVIRVTLNESNMNVSVSVFLGRKNGSVIGRSVDSTTGLPVEYTRFLLCHAADPKVCWRPAAKSDDGRFQFAAPHVPFTLKAMASHYEDWLGLTGTDRGPITVAPGATIELSVYLRRRPEAAKLQLSEAEKLPSVNLPAPVQLLPDDGATFDFYPRRTKLEWTPVEGAVSYTVEVDYCDGRDGNRRVCSDPQPLELKQNSSQEGIQTTTYEILFVGAQPGRWRVWAIDSKGRAGFKSPWRTFFYLK
jgi:hypothetical protein